MPMYNNFTPLNQSLSNILMQVEPRGILTAPPKIKGLSNRRDKRMRSRDSSDRDNSENLSAVRIPSKSKHNVKLSRARRSSSEI